MFKCCKPKNTGLNKNLTPEIEIQPVLRCVPAHPTPADRCTLLPYISRHIFNNKSLPQFDIEKLADGSLVKTYLSLPESGKCMSMDIISRQEFDDSIIFRGPHTIRGGQFRAGGLSNTTVVIFDETLQVNFDECTNCEFIVACCNGSVFLHSCDNCTISVICGQFRSQSSKNCNIFIHCRTEPVIEFSTGLHFYPFAFKMSHSHSNSLDIETSVFRSDLNDVVTAYTNTIGKKHDSVAFAFNWLLYAIMYNSNIDVELNKAGKVHDFSLKSASSFNGINTASVVNFEAHSEADLSLLPVFPLNDVLDAANSQQFASIMDLAVDFQKTRKPAPNVSLINAFLPTAYDETQFKSIATNKKYTSCKNVQQKTLTVDDAAENIVEDNVNNIAAEPQTVTEVNDNNNQQPLSAVNVDLQVTSINKLGTIRSIVKDYEKDFESDTIRYICPVLVQRNIEAFLEIIAFWEANPNIKIYSIHQAYETKDELLVLLMNIKNQALVSKILQDTTLISGAWEIRVDPQYGQPKILPKGIFALSN